MASWLVEVTKMPRRLMAGRALLIAALTLYVLLGVLTLANIHLSSFTSVNLFFAAGLLLAAGGFLTALAKRQAVT